MVGTRVGGAGVEGGETRVEGEDEVGVEVGSWVGKVEVDDVAGVSGGSGSCEAICCTSASSAGTAGSTGSTSSTGDDGSVSGSPDSAWAGRLLLIVVRASLVDFTNRSTREGRALSLGRRPNIALDWAFELVHRRLLVWVYHSRPPTVGDLILICLMSVLGIGVAMSSTHPRKCKFNVACRNEVPAKAVSASAMQTVK